jgi:hypothetical protein
MKASLALIATIVVVAALNACGNPNSLQASLPTSVDSLSLWALSGTPPTFPRGLSITARQAVRVDASASFDVALDINDAGEPVVYPEKLIVSTPGGSRPVGIQLVTGSFDEIAEAPKTGFETDSALVLAPGQTVIVQSPHNASGEICEFAISPQLYAKITVDSVNLASRVLYFRMGLDPNCGFRSFADGIPTS